ncbi:membrane metallo-endopeptidase-like 1 isoform X3 [Myzus persicae]|uniref:membrane metallo-endopeptidase-like 1 isoform X3 n=1 Tax=Myzus persicae TaxID=13164 RepID=UPI000B931E36|nr:membrane metallo-endopeptidase-like 1 isoform X3 [Myzus persicae]
MSDDKDLPMSKIKGDGPIDPESGYSKMFKNQMESRRTFYVVLTLLIFIIVVLIIAVFGLSFAYLKMTEDQRQICTTEDCLRSATILVESMNKSVDPCEDFYQFACGNFAKLHKIPKTAVSNDRFIEVDSSMLVLVRDFLERDDVEDEPSSISKSRRLYRSCMATAIDRTKTEYVIKQLIQILETSGLPFNVIINRKKASNISSILARLKKRMNLDYLFMVNVQSDTKNRTLNRITLSKPSATDVFPVYKLTDTIKKMGSKKLIETVEKEKKTANPNEDETHTNYKYFINKYNKYLCGVLVEMYELKYVDCIIYLRILKIDEILSFNDEHSKIIYEIYDTDNPDLPVVTTVDELQEYTNYVTQIFTDTNETIIDWKEYLTIIFMDVKNVTLDFETDLIQIYNFEYFEALFKLISKHKDQLIINIWWEAVRTLLPYTTNEMRFLKDRFLYETSGFENNPSRSLYCANAVNTMMGMAVSRLLLDIEQIYRNMKMAAEMNENIHWAFEKIVKELNWMDDTTKQRTLYKAQQMRTLIGFPEFINDSKKLDDYYSEFEVIENDYFGNVIRYVQQILNNSLKLLRESNNFNTSNSWALDPLEVNAFHWYQANTINVPAGVLQFPFFGHDLQILNYGFFGSMLGHELTHGFDNTGRRFDQDGNENMWWTNQSTAEYEKRTKCFIHHYDSYLIPELKKKDKW